MNRPTEAPNHSVDLDDKKAVQSTVFAPSSPSHLPKMNMSRANAQCVQATLQPRQRRRKFTERALLDRIRHYEDLLRKNNIDFEQLGPASIEKPLPSEDSRAPDTPDDDHSESGGLKPKRFSKQQPVPGLQYHEAKDLEDDGDNYDSENDDFSSGFLHEVVRDAIFVKVWDKLSEGNDHLLFGPHENLDLSAFHPGQVQIFRLWQIYLDNVNPLLKVTHTPTLQPRIIDAASDVTNISPALEALMFSIYCVSVLSMVHEDCQTLFEASREELLRNYRFGCQQALLNCGILRTNDRDCLTALYLYIISVRPHTDPRSLSSILGVAVRIAQRMGITREITNTKNNVLEAEMRRRLWWSLTLFDNRICEMSGFRAAAQSVSWSCKLPLNANDFDLRPEMKTAPPAHEDPTEALFVVVRSELGNYIYQRALDIDFSDLSTLLDPQETKSIHDPNAVNALEKKLEDKYLSFCNPENPLHFMTLWITRGALARFRLEEHYAKIARSSTDQPHQLTDLQRDAAMSWALTMLTCDTKVSTSPLTKGYVWLLNVQFPFFAYLHLCTDLGKRPFLPNSAYIWDLMSDNFEARFENSKGRYGSSTTLRSYFDRGESDGAMFRIFSQAILSAWDAHENALSEAGRQISPPRIILRIRRKLEELAADTGSGGAQQDQKPPGAGEGMSMAMDPVPMAFTTVSFDTSGPALGQAAMEAEMNQVDWDMIDWSMMSIRS
ncbi:hypothetical protein DV736_g5311, partial [Chaetothyriales sp. CBS 134916]